MIFADKTNIADNDFIIGLFTGAGLRWPQKSLAFAKQKELLKQLAENYPDGSIALFGGPSEENLNTLLLRESPANVVSEGCHNSLPKFASLINLVSVLITPDTLALHIALALKKQVVAYFGPTAPWEVELFGIGKRIIAPVDCIACCRSDCPKSPKCSELISVGDIINATDQMAKIYS
jgi:ADP-heptose:LPS heptosyltransferase